MSQPGNLKNRTEKHTGRETAIRGNFRAAAAKNTAGEEAATYTVMMPDWAPRSFGVWPSPNEKCEITHWEIHVRPEHSDFLDAAIGVHGLLYNGAGEYMQAMAKRMKEKGVEIHLR